MYVLRGDLRRVGAPAARVAAGRRGTDREESSLVSAPWLLYGLLVLALGAGAALYTFVPGTSMLFSEWYSAPCLVDANGDDVLDVAGMFATPGSERWQVGVVDGKTGASLWSGERYAPQAGFDCLSPRFFGVDNTDFTLSLFPAGSPTAPLAVRVSDHVSQLGVGTGCVSIGMKNGQSSALALDGKPLVACPAVAVPQPTSLVSFSPQGPFTLEAGGVKYSLDAQANGTAFLILSASRGERVLWQSNLRYVKSRGNLRMVATPDVIVVYGSDPTDDNYGFIIGIEPGTGAQRYAVRQDSHLSGNIWSFEFNRRYVIAAWGFGLHAYDPKTGERVWHIGGR